MRCLGIPNTAHFANVTQIEDAMALWEKLRGQKSDEAWKPEQVMNHLIIIEDLLPLSDDLNARRTILFSSSCQKYDIMICIHVLRRKMLRLYEANS